MKNYKIDYPKAYEILKADISEDMISRMSEETKASEEFDTFFQSVVLANLDTIIDSNYSKIANMLDKHGVFTTIELIFEPEKVIYCANINGTVAEKRFDSRRMAERFVIENSLEILNNKSD